MPKFHVPKPSDRPDGEVLVDGAWWQGELRMWTQHDDGTWTAKVQYQPPDGDSLVIRTFPAGEVRAADSARGRHEGAATPSAPV